MSSLVRLTLFIFIFVPLFLANFMFLRFSNGVS